jgi:hypothetical protein
MKNANEVSLEAVLVTVLNVAAVYLAAFSYRLNWTGVLTVMVFASLFTAVITHILVSKAMAAKENGATHQRYIGGHGCCYDFLPGSLRHVNGTI